jgi:hypothetical protein
MPDLVQNDVLQYSIRYLQEGQTFLNTWTFRYNDDITGTDDYVAMCNQFMADLESPTAFLDVLRGQLHTSCTIYDHRMQLIYPSRLTAVVRSYDLPGTVTGAALPTNTAAVLTKRSINATRWGIGSWHQPGLPASALTSAGVMNAAYMTALDGNVSTSLFGNITPTGANGSLEAVIWGKAVPLRFSVITSVEPQPTPRVMRRRTVGVGI